MKSTFQITPPQWMRDPALLNLMMVLNKGDLNALLVGGCLRDHLYGLPVHDIDIATRLKPDQVIERLNAHNIKNIPTGIHHGTITAVIHHRHFEITSLRHDHNPDGRHADVTFDADWTDDAHRRDFTINALYGSCDGDIYDPLGTGIDDCHAKIVRFIGDPENRIREDFLRILRFFRFYAGYHDGSPHMESFDACKALKHGIDNLSSERIHEELYKILSTDHAVKGVKAMADATLFDIQTTKIDELEKLISLQRQLNCVDINTRFYHVGFDKKYIKAIKIIRFFDQLQKFKSSWDHNILLALYRYERPVVLQGLLSLKSEGVTIDDIVIADAMNKATPQMPVTANDIMERFNIEPSPEVGEKLREAENIWIQSEFKMNRYTLLDEI